MRQPALLLLFLLLGISATRAQSVSIAATKMNVCYADYDNPLAPAATACADSKLILTTDNGAVHHSSGEWIYRPDRPGNATLKLWCRKGRDSVLIGQLSVRVKELPAPIAVVGDAYEGSITAGALRVQTGVSASLPDSDLDFPVRVHSYTFALQKKDGRLQTADVTGAYFAGDAAEAIRHASPGDKLMITKIVAGGPDSKLLRLNNITLDVR